MKFTVFLLAYFMSEIQCVKYKGWQGIGYKNEYFCSLGWCCYLKRLFLIIFMMSGVILYYLPGSRYYFRRGCHGLVDFVADGLKTALNVTDAEYTSDYATSLSSARESEVTVRGKTSLAIPIFSGFGENVKNVTSRVEGKSRSGTNIFKSEDNYKCHHYRRYYREDIGKLHTFSTTKDSVLFPPETIQLYPENNGDFGKFSGSKYFLTNDRDSDSSETIGISSRNDRRYSVRAEKVIEDHEKLIILEESEVTNYPEEDTIYDCTGSEDESENNYRHRENESLNNLKNRKILEQRLVEFDQNLCKLRSLFVRKYSNKSENGEEYGDHLIEEILQSLKRYFDGIDAIPRTVIRRPPRKFKTSGKNAANRRGKKKIPSDENNHQLVRKVPRAASTISPVYRTTPLERKKFRSTYPKNFFAAHLSSKRYNSFSAVQAETSDIPIITSSFKPMLERAFRWFYGTCPGMEKSLSAVGNVDIDENEALKRSRLL